MKKILCSVLLLCAVIKPVYTAEPGSFFASGSRDKKELSLTFDDGPGNATLKILEVLKRYEVKAAFFMEGSQAELRPAIARKVFEEGHEVYSHLYSHPNFYAYKKDDYRQLLEAEMDKAEKAIIKVTGKRPAVIRMPHGYVKKWVKETAKEKGYVLVNWTFGCDWKKMSVEELVVQYTNNIGPGTVFLMHDGGGNRQRTADALPKIIEGIEKKGYKIVPVEELLGLDAAISKK